MNKLKARLYLWWVGFSSPLDRDIKFLLAMILAAIIVFYATMANCQTITKYYDNSNKIRIEGSTNELKPCFLFFPGGGFMSQNWQICNSWSSLAVNQGYVSCKVGYSVSFPSLSAANKGIQDGVNALKWVKLHANEYHIDTNRIYLAGTSAGGFVALGIAYQHKQKVTGVLNGWGGVLNLTYLYNNNIPVYNVSTDYDKTVPIDCGNAFGVSCCGSQSIYTQLLLLEVKTDWLVWEGYKHGLLPKDIEYSFRVTHSFLNFLTFIK